MDLSTSRRVGFDIDSLLADSSASGARSRHVVHTAPINCVRDNFANYVAPGKRLQLTQAVLAIRSRGFCRTEPQTKSNLVHCIEFIHLLFAKTAANTKATEEKAGHVQITTMISGNI